MNLYTVYLCYQPIKNMKYIGPKGSVVLPINRKQKPLLQHCIDHIDGMFDRVCHHMVVGFEGDKVLKCLQEQSNLSYSTIPEYKTINHGKIIADIIKKYQPDKYDGLLIFSDIGCVITKPLDIDPSKNYIFCFNDDYAESGLTCNVVNNLVEHISFNSSNYYWSGLCYLNNATIKLLRFINTIKFTDPMFTWEIINYLKDRGTTFNLLQLNKKQYKYISNEAIKSTKVTK